MASWTVERLGKRHDRTRFDCGNAVLNEWLKQRAGQFDRRDLARTYVAVRPGEPIVLGYYALSSHTVCYEAFPADEAKKLPHIDLPVVLLGRLAWTSPSKVKALAAICWSTPCAERSTSRTRWAFERSKWMRSMTTRALSICDAGSFRSKTIRGISSCR